MVHKKHVSVIRVNPGGITYCCGVKCNASTAVAVSKEAVITPELCLENIVTFTCLQRLIIFV